MITQCVILLGGKGTRLGSITEDFPKPMLDVGGKPFAEYLIDISIRHGINDFLLLAGHSSEIVTNYFKEYKGSRDNLKLNIIVEKYPLGTGGALVNAYDALEDTFLLLNGDSIIDGNWSELANNFSEDIDICIGLTNINNTERYGSVTLEGERVISFKEKRKVKVNYNNNLINAGIYIVRKRILKNIEVKNFSFEEDILMKNLTNLNITGKVIKGYFIDIGLPETLKEAYSIKWIKNKKAIIFDRDGTLNIDNGYTNKVSDLVWVDGAKDLIKEFNDKNIYVFVATNQAGIGKGIFTENNMQKFHLAMQNELQQAGAHIDKFYFCPFHVDSVIEKYKIDAKCRKPNTGMLENITLDWGINKENMILIGDRDTDINCAKNFNIKSIKYNGLDKISNLSDNINKFFG